MAAGRGGPAAPGAPASPPGGGRAEEPKSALETRSGLLGTPKFRGSFSTNPPPQKEGFVRHSPNKKYGTFFFRGVHAGGPRGQARPPRSAPRRRKGRGAQICPRKPVRPGAPPQAPQSRGSSFTNANKSHKRSKWTSSFDMYVIDTWVYLCPYDKFYSCSPKK